MVKKKMPRDGNLKEKDKMFKTKRTKPITKSEYEAYEAVRQSGVTNMFAVNVVSDLTGLDIDTIKAIMNQYTELREKYGGED